MKYYLDWCPRSSSGALRSTVSRDVSLKTLSDFLSRYDALSEAEKLIDSDIIYAIRPDGLFIFCVNWVSAIESDSEADVRRRILIANIISSIIKEANSHFHIFDKDGISERFKHEHPSYTAIVIDPVELYEFYPNGGLGQILSNDQELCDLNAAPLGERRASAESALVYLRSQFAQCFDNACMIKFKIQNYNLQPKFFDKPIYPYKHGFYVSIYLIFLFSEILMEGYERIKVEFQEDSIATHFSMKEIADFFWDRAFALMIPLLIIVYIASVSLKRRKILKVLSKTKGFLLFGNIFSDIIINIFDKCDDGRKHISKFDDSINIIDSMIYLEEKKRMQTQFTLGILFIISFSRFKEYINEGNYIRDVPRILWHTIRDRPVRMKTRS